MPRSCVGIRIVTTSSDTISPIAMIACAAADHATPRATLVCSDAPSPGPLSRPGSGSESVAIAGLIVDDQELHVAEVGAADGLHGHAALIVGDPDREVTLVGVGRL